MDDLRYEIRLVIATQLNVPLEKVTESALWSDLDADSLDIIQVVIRLEEMFGLGYTSDMTVKDLAEQPVSATLKYVEEHTNKK